LARKYIRGGQKNITFLGVKEISRDKERFLKDMST